VATAANNERTATVA